MKKMMLIVGGVAAMAAVYLGSQLLAQQPGTPAAPPAQTRVAFVNIVTVFQNYQKANIYKAEMERLIKPKQAEAEQLRQEMIKWDSDMRDPKFDPAKKEQWTKGILNNKRRLEDLQAEMAQVLGKKNEEQLVQLYSEINEAVKAHAAAQGFHIVLAYGENTKLGSNNIANIARKIQGMEVALVPMYFHPGLEISMAVAEALNRQYPPAAGQSLTPAGGFKN